MEMDGIAQNIGIGSKHTGKPLATNADPILCSVPQETSKLCSFCGKKFAQASGLTKHKERCKMDDKPKNICIICVYCGKNFAHRSSLHRHEQMCKTENSDERKFKCLVCYATFSRVDNYKRHYRSCNSSLPKSVSATCKMCHQTFSRSEDIEGHTCNTKKKLLLASCLYENCKMAFYRRSQLTRHLRKAHGNTIEDERIFTFANMTAFLEWKRTEEQNTFSYFTKRSGTRGGIDYYYCQLDGSSKPHCKSGVPARKTSRRIKKGTTKQDKICLAKIKVKIVADGTCNVVYQPTHSHKLNIRDFRPHILLTHTVKYINEQLFKGVPPKKCFKPLIDGTFEYSESELNNTIKTNNPILVSGVNTMALCKRVKMKNNKDDAISVMIRVALLSKECPNPVILYKPLGEDKVIGPTKVDKLPNSQDLFMLGIQTKGQKAMLLQHSAVTISVGWVDDTNAYGYRLLTIVVPDEHNRSYPIAYFILNQFNEATLSCCLLSIKESCPELILHTVIIPDNLQIIEAFKKTFEYDVNYILCLNSFHKKMQQYLDGAAPNELISELYQSLCNIVECNDESEVVNLLEQFTETYIERATNFVIFFKEQYMCRVEQWTRAYRKFWHNNIDTTVLNESIHNQIKAADVVETSSRRLDDLINILLDIEEDKYQKRYIEEMMGIPSGLGDVPTRHLDGLKISDECIVQLHDTVWEIKCEIDPQKYYEVVQCTDGCTNEVCYFTCKALVCNGLCSHMYSCSCADKNPLCLHIHKLQTFLVCRSVEIEELPESNSDDESKSCQQNIIDISDVSVVIPNKQLTKIKEYLKDLSILIESDCEPQVLNRIESCLYQLVTECGASEVPDIPSIPFNRAPTQILQGITKHEYVSDGMVKDDPARYEFEYVQQNSYLTEGGLEEKDSALNQFEAKYLICTLTSFTPSLDYANLNRIIIKCGTEELSLLHIKSLDPFLTDEELSSLQLSEQFQEQYMHSTLINAFLLHLQFSHNQIVPISSDIALTLETNENAKTFFSKELLEKDVLIMPMNLSDKYWTCIAVFNKEKEIIYYNPFGTMTKKDEKTITNFLNGIEEDVEWNITIPNYKEQIQNDSMGYGVHICHFAEEIAKHRDLTPLLDTKAYRKHIYDTIVGNCLKRDQYDNSLCGKCNSNDCPHIQDETADLSICCSKCGQWYHNVCIGIEEMNICNMDFTCPI